MEASLEHPGTQAAASEPETTLREGDVVDGKYRVDHLLGEGGMAAVWAGTNVRTGKRVALKVILRSLKTMPEAEGLFRSEGLAASRVNHPNVVTVFDVIEHEGMACLVMELLDGEPLGSYIARNGPLSVNEATVLLLPAMRGVAAAHAQGVIHRDLKPQNIFICIGPDGRVVTTKVLDFGISVIMKRSRDRSTGLIAGVLGTPAYMSPEHIWGAADIDVRADVYGFGVLLYEALTGQAPFPGEPGSDLLRRILNEPAPPLSRVRPDLPPGLVRIVETAMAKEPNHRYSDLNLMVSALEDEIIPTSLAPRSLTPYAGVPLSGLYDPLSGQSDSVVQAIVGRDPSGQFPKTRIFYGQRLEDESGGTVTNTVANSGSGRLLEATAPLPPAYRVRPWLAGAGLVVVLAFVAWMAPGGGSKVETAAPAMKVVPPASKPAAPPAVPAVAPTTIAPPGPAAALPAVPPTRLAAGTFADTETSMPASQTRAERGSVIPGRSGPAIREASKGASPRRSVAQAQTKGDRPAPGTGGSAKPAGLRAGTLSADDF
jgi:serine/threonine-protein kinase